MIYYPGFDVSRLTLGNMQILPTVSGGLAYVYLSAITAADADGNQSSKFFHFDHSVGTTPLNEYEFGSTALRLTDWALGAYVDAVQTAARAAAVSAGGWTDPNDLDITIDNDTGLITISYTESIVVYWTESLGHYLFGHTEGQVGATIVSGVQPYYTISPTVPAADSPSPPYEPDGGSTMAMADDGSSFGISRTTNPLHLDWMQKFETKAKTLKSAAQTSHLFTFQHLFGLCRSVYPFVVHDGGLDSTATAYAFKLRNDGNYLDWASARATPGNDNQFHIPFRCILEGLVT